MLLVGFMASGKSTVGRLLADRLGWEFVDLDRLIELWSGRTVAAIFAEQGEEAFREIEARLGREQLERERVVLAPGGGWAAAEGDRMETLPEGTLSVWLRVAPEVALARAAERPGSRPLLDGSPGEALERARTLLERREPHYRKSRLHLDTDRATPDAIVAAVLDHL